MKAWIPEPDLDDPTWSREDESLYEWLIRSTHAEARAYREFLNRQLSQLPPEFAARSSHRLASHWQSTLFEIFVARTLQILGGELESEELGIDGKRPDFGACFADGAVTVEAVSPEIQQESRRESEEIWSLIPVVREAVPDGWAVHIDELPTIGPRDSKKPLKRALARLAPQNPPRGEVVHEAEEMLDKGRLALTYYPNPDGYDKVIALPVMGGWDDSERRIRTVLKKKRPQLRRGSLPVLLAVQNSCGVDFESFDRALFRRRVTVESFRYPHKWESRNEVRWDGEFMRARVGPPTYAGVLAFLRLGPYYTSDPVLYLHPRFKGELPKALRGLETRKACRDSDLSVRPAKNPGFMRGIGFL